MLFLKKNNALTVLELIVVVVIVGLLAAITVPNFSKTLAKSREKLAKSNLQMILSAQKLYRASNDSFYESESGGTIYIEEINKALNLDIEDKYFDYEVEYKDDYDFEARAKSKINDNEYVIGPEGFID
ncbi:MAG: hypothetical protein P9X27_00370 [Candidatus Kaelpia aquatica]|nr:hypothetical protein [Candidatus Kaelpia aquatica]